MAFSRYVITNAGRDLQLDCLATGDFQIHSLVLGTGEYSGLLTEITDVVAPVITFGKDQLTIVRRDNQIEVRAKLSNEQIEMGFMWREYGLYAENGEKTVLYCYDNAGAEPIPITSAASGAGISNTIKVILTIDQAATVNVSFLPEADFPVDDVVTADGENAVSGKAVAAYAATTAAYTATIPTTGWSSAAPYSVQIAVDGMLASDIPFVDIVQTGSEATDAPIREAWALITRITTADGSITVYAAEEIPEVEIPIQMKVVR